MSYQPGGGYGQQPGASGQPYGQQYPGYGQPAGGQPTGGQQAAGQQSPGVHGGSLHGGGQQPPQSYGQPAYGGQPSYGQQPPGRYDYGAQAPVQPRPSAGLPANVRLILAAVVGGLGVLTLFCGFLPGVREGSASIPVFGAASQFAAPYLAIVVAGLLALTFFLPGDKTPPVAVVTALTLGGTVVALFAMISKGDYAPDTGAGAIILLVVGVLMSIAAVLWLLVDSGLVKTADTATAAPGVSSAPGVPNAPGTPAAPGDSSGYAAPPAPAPSSSDPQSYGSYGTYGATQYSPSYGQGAPGGGKSPADPAAPSSGPSYGGYPNTPGTGSTPGSDSTTTVFNNPGRSGGGQPGGGQPGGGQQSNFSSGPGYGV